MKLFLTISAFCLFSAVLGAQTCDVSKLNGPYGFTASGTFGDYRGNTSFNAGGRLVADGHGALTIKDTVNLFGQTTRGEFYSGQYTMNSDCTGTLTFNSFAAGVINYDFTLASNGDILFVSADPGKSITGTGKRMDVAPILL